MASMGGLLAYAAYVPHHRLKRSAIAAALGSGGGNGTRAVASYDEDTTTMGVAAARLALRSVPGLRPAGLYFSTSAPAYVDKTNATAIHAALGLDAETIAIDMGGAPRSGVGALLAANDAPRPTLAVLSDLRFGLPGSSDERDGGDAAAAFLFGTGEVIAEVVAFASSTSEFLDRWRPPTSTTSRVWEERFGESAYVPLAEASLADALKRADVTPDEVDHAVVAGVHGRAVRRVVGSCGLPKAAFADDLSSSVGATGTAHAGVLLADVLDRAGPNQTIVLTVLADGAATIVLRTTQALAAYRRATPVAEQAAQGDDSLDYQTYLTWRGLLDREPPRRPDPEAPAAPPSARNSEWKFHFAGSRCEECSTVQVPPSRVCVKCESVDNTTSVPLADVPATVATFTIDRLAFTLSPPMVAAVLDFDGGGRFRCQLTDVAAESVGIGDRVEMTFRRLATAHGIHNYFWKARPLRVIGKDA
jgi:hydroxymethylglutaryl-CoA synthase